MFSDTIKSEVADLHKKIPPIDLRQRAVFLWNLIFCYQFVIASHHLAINAWDGAEGALKDYFFKHAEEEKDHALWLKEDLASASIATEDLATEPYAEWMVGTQYYGIFFKHPAYLLGYMAFLEMQPISLEVVEQLEKIHGTQLLRTVRFHAENDPGHAKDLCAIIDAIDGQYQKLILESLRKTAEYFTVVITKFAKESVNA